MRVPDEAARPKDLSDALDERVREVLRLIEAPTRAAQIPAEEVARVVSTVCGLEAALGTIKIIVASRLGNPPAVVVTDSPDESDVVGLDDAQRITGRTEDWLRRNWRRHGLASQDAPRSRLRWSRKRCQQYHARYLVRPAA